MRGLSDGFIHDVSLFPSLNESLAMPQCLNCQFYRQDKITTERNTGSGECRKRPPIVPRDSHDRFYPNFAIFPTVFENGWCGEFTPQRNASAVRRDMEANAAFDAGSHGDSTVADVCGLTGNV